jgi:filamentous hemagglutinin
MKLWHLPERALGALQCIGGMSQVAVGVGGGLLSFETGIGPTLGASLATIGLDNAYAGCSTLWTGKHQTTLLNQGLQGFGLDETEASYFELVAGVSPFIAPKLLYHASSIKEIAVFTNQEARTYLGLRNYNPFSSPIVYNSRSSKAIAENVFNKIDRSRFNTRTRFGPAFYLSQKVGTTMAELGFHQSRATHTIKFIFNDKKAIILDLTQPSIANK